MSESREHIRNAILQEAIRLAPFEGWHEPMLRKAVINAGYSDFDLERVFPSGVKEILGYWAEQTDHQMLEALAKKNLEDMKIRQRIFTGVKTRLDILLPYREALRRAIAWYSVPFNLPLMYKLVWNIASEIWYAAGDTSTDYNWYTKRFLLSKIYSATVLYWLNDESENQQDTWEFLERRIDDVMQFEKYKSKAIKSAERFTPAGMRRTT
jgi:ubiquinone biosynthesis protein COQ9